jgi:hypothetical protein
LPWSLHKFRDPFFQVCTAAGVEIGGCDGRAGDRRESCQTEKATSKAIHANSIFIITLHSRQGTALVGRRPIMTVA